MEAPQKAVVTTAAKQEKLLSKKARELAKMYNFPFVPRRKQPLTDIINTWNLPVIVYGKIRLELYLEHNSPPFFFHPNTAALKVRKLVEAGTSPLTEAGKIKQGDVIVDCTLGLGADSLLMAAAAGPEGEVTGIESSMLTALIVKEGLQHFPMPLQELQQAASRINVLHGRAETILSAMEKNSADIVYLDPMFNTPLSKASGIDPLRKLADYNPVTEELIQLAVKTARRGVVIKEHTKSPVFEKYGFTVKKRRGASFQYGFLTGKEGEG
jgi:16S rRNA (guanine1516-N2)-methyltransferase